MTVKGSKVSREITTTYLKDECALEMVIRVPSSYPLRSVEVECTRRIGITEDRWRRWVLQIIKVTSAQDGSLLDAVLLWKQNVDKEFEGVEPCPICYSILNPKTMGLPNLSCKTCANKYHNSCLYKWFNQSGKNKCPICQQPFT
jgi:E3 ubiquitin-protein ligase listerin